MIKVRMMTPWVEVEERPGEWINTPKVFEDYPPTPGCSYTEVTNLPQENMTPDPNMVVIEVVIPQELFDAIEADPNYFILSEEQI